MILNGIDVLIEKPITSTLDQARELVELSEQYKRILQVGHLERFNGAILTLDNYLRDPRFIESHRLAPFIERGVDVDVVLDLMIHDIDIILSMVKSKIKNIDAVGIPVISPKIDIANARLQFENGCLVNVTASRVSLKKERKMRIFQPNAYFSLNFAESLLHSCALEKEETEGKLYPFKVTRINIKVPQVEPLKAELEAFINSCLLRSQPLVSGQQGLEALSVAFHILEKIANN